MHCRLVGVEAPKPGCHVARAVWVQEAACMAAEYAAPACQRRAGHRLTPAEQVR